MRILSSTLLLLCLTSSLFFCGALTATADETVPSFSQTPRKGSGGCMAVALPMEVTGGWHHVYRAADDFLLTEKTEISEVVWWGCSSDGRHGEDDGLDQVLGFAIAFYEHNPDTKQPGTCVHRTIVPLQETAPQRTRFESLGGSDVMRFKAALVAPFQAQAETRYWISVAAYLSGEPMWVWFESAIGNGQGAYDHGVNGAWADQPEHWRPLDLAFELRGESASEKKARKDLDESGDTDASDTAAMERLIKQLGQDEYDEREVAENKLAAIGIAAAPFLTPHLKHDDPEIRFRVRRLLTKCEIIEEALPMKIHTVREGEKISDLADMYGVAGETIINANALGDQTPRAGIMLLIPR